MSVFVGLDCGGSSTRVMATDDAGSLLFQGQSGAANVANTPENRLRRSLASATQGCPSADFVCAGMAGVVNASTRERATKMLREIFPGAQVRVEPDYTAAYFACPLGTDVCVISGTGSLVCSQEANSDLINRSGGGGYLLGDEGSAYQYGRDAIRQFLQAPNEASDTLLASIHQQFGTIIAGDVVAEIYRTPAPATILAKLAKSLIADYRAGHAYAIRSVEYQTEGLAQVVLNHIHHFELQTRNPLRLCLAGGLWKGASEIQAAFEGTLSRMEPTLSVLVTRIEKPPIHGALTLAHRMVTG